MGKRAITVYSINVDTGGTVNIHGAKYISKFNSPFLKVSKERTVLLLFFFFFEQTFNFRAAERLHS